jgi:small redox-active disulfide protein 2
VEIKVLGTGCAKCNKLYEQVMKAVAGADVQADVSKVEKLDQIMAHGVMMTPALVVDGEVKVVGKVPKVDEIVTWLLEAAT